MSLLQKPLQKKLSALLGLEVTFERMSVSLLRGTLDIHGVTVAGEDPAAPILTIKRVRAEVALARALAKEVVVRSLTVERPVLCVVRRADGRTNLPQSPLVAERLTAAETHADDSPRRPCQGGGADRAGGRGQTDAAPGARNRTDPGDDEGADHTWRFDAERVLVVDGEASFRDEAAGGSDGARPDGAYHVVAGPVLAEVKHAGSEVEFTFIVESVGRRGEPPLSAFGPVKATGVAAGVVDLTKLAAAASARAQLDVGDALTATVTAPDLRGRSFELTAGGAVDLAPLLPLLPPGVSLPWPMSGGRLAGRIELNARATYAPAEGLRIPELAVRLAEVSVGGAGAAAGTGESVATGEEVGRPDER